MAGDIPATGLFTATSMVTLGGASASVFAICNGLQRAFNFNPRWLGLFVSQVIAFAGIYSTNGDRLVDYIVAFINGFFIFATAAGVTSLGANTVEMTARGNEAGGETSSSAERHRRFLTPW